MLVASHTGAVFHFCLLVTRKLVDQRGLAYVWDAQYHGVETAGHTLTFVTFQLFLEQLADCGEYFIQSLACETVYENAGGIVRAVMFLPDLVLRGVGKICLVQQDQRGLVFD